MAHPYKGFTIIATTPALTEQFRTFCAQNRPDSMEKAVEFFAVFGGIGCRVDTGRPLIEEIERHILSPYRLLHKEVSALTAGESAHYALLAGFATGDGRIHSALKRARMSDAEAAPALAELCRSGIVRRVSPKQRSRKWMEEHPVSDKLLFNSPFLRFWFGFVAPIFKGIKEGNYDEFKERFANKKQELFQGVFEELAIALLKESFPEDPITQAEAYWDVDTAIDILATTASGKEVAGSCRYSDAKLKKSELVKLQEQCAAARIAPDIFVLFAKKGFSSELKASKGESLRLFSAKNLKKLLEQ